MINLVISDLKDMQDNYKVTDVTCIRVFTVLSLIDQAEVDNDYSLENNSIGWYDFGGAASYDNQRSYYAGMLRVNISIPFTLTKKEIEIITDWLKEYPISELKEFITGSDIEFDGDTIYVDMDACSLVLEVGYTSYPS